MDAIVQAVLQALPKAMLVQVEVSARHVHLTQTAMEALFGPGAVLTPKRTLSQPGQYLAGERVTLIGPKGKKERTAILGPSRPVTQVELSRSDCVELGVEAPLRESGDVEGSGVITLEGPHGAIGIRQGVIIAHNHIHLTPRTAELMGLKNHQHVKVEVITERPLLFTDVIVRVHEKFADRMHIDVDEANAAFVKGFTLGRILP